MFTDKMAGSYWIIRLLLGGCPSPVGLGNSPSRPELPATQAYSGLIGDDLTLSKVIFH